MIKYIKLWILINKLHQNIYILRYKTNNMDKKELILITIIIATLITFSSFLYFSNSNFITGNAVAEGQVIGGGDKEKANPSKGVLKGTVNYTISEGETIVNREYAENATLYFVETGDIISNYSKILSSSKNYKQNIVTIDVDSAITRCSLADYPTNLNYYDENSNLQEDNSEFNVYNISTDVNGCYAVKLPKGSYDIYL